MTTRVLAVYKPTPIAKRNKGGRPPKYSWEQKVALVEKVCDLIATGDLVLLACQEAGIRKEIFYKWVHNHPEFEHCYTRALSLRTTVFAENVLELVLQPLPTNAFGNTDTGAVALRRLQMDTVRWYVGKINPKKYGKAADKTEEAQEVESSVQTVERVIIDPKEENHE